MSTGLLDFDEIAKRALRGEKTNPCPGCKYYIVAVRPDIGNFPCPVLFDSPEDAVLALIAMSRILSDDCTYDVAVTDNGTIQ